MPKKPQETSVPLIIALVFFILTTIAFGVMWYLSYSDMEQALADVKKEKDAQTPLKNTARDWELKARVYRVYLGIADPDDIKTIDAEAKPGDVIATELDNINTAMKNKLAVPNVSDLPEEFKFWTTDASKKANPAPARGLVDQFAELKNREAVYQAAEKERDAYRAQINAMKKLADDLAAVQKKFDNEINRLPAEFKAELEKVTKAFDKRTKDYEASEAASRKQLDTLSEEKAQLLAEVTKLQKIIAGLQSDNQVLQEKIRGARGDSQFAYDEPQGKILRRLPDGVVEINLGSAVNVRPGLTFTVLPPDFPEKGRQSRMRMVRVPDGKGYFTSVETFIPKGSIEVYQVLGPNLSLARIQPGTELDPIRDGIAVGDLLYNSAWRKGVADHIALIGIFDINGDGIDDIQNVVRELTKMGIPVDAYYDMKKRAWVGEVTERTRFLVEGYMPINSATDPNRDEKTKLLGLISNAINDAKRKGVEPVNFRDFFSRMGYKFRLDVTDDKINQATAPYLSNVTVGETFTPPSP